MSLLSIRNSSSASSITTTEPPKPKQKEPWLIVGLGNPGKKYAATRHNFQSRLLTLCWSFYFSLQVGFEMVDTIAEAEGISMNSVSFKALFGKGFIGDVPVILAKPQTFMNLSGESVSPLSGDTSDVMIRLGRKSILKVGAIVSYYRIPLKQVLVIFDD